MSLVKFLVVYPFIYSFLEWNIHRFLYVFDSRRHREHHYVLKSDDDYSSSLKKSLQTFLFISPFCFIDPDLVSLWINYTMYEFIHCWLHRHRSPASTFHTIHHFSRDWNRNYGVLSPFWDGVFGTLRTGQRIKWWKFLYNWNPYLFPINF